MRDLGSIPGLGRSPVGRHDNPFWYCFLENPHGQKSLASSVKEWDTTELLNVQVPFKDVYTNESVHSNESELYLILLYCSLIMSGHYYLNFCQFVGFIILFCFNSPLCFNLVCMLSLVRFSATLWTVACQVPLSMKFSGQE